MCLTLTLGKRDGPVRVVVADRGRDKEAVGKLGVNGDFHAGVEFGDEGALDLGVGNDVVVDVLVQLAAGMREIVLSLVLSEYRRIEAVLDRVVGQVFNDER